MNDKVLIIFNFTTLIVLGILSISTSLKFKKNELPWKVIALYLIGSFFAQSLAYIYWDLNKNNLKILHIYSLFQFIAFSVFYWSITTKKVRKQLIIVLSGSVSILLIINSLWNESLRDFNSLGVFFSNGTIIVYSVTYFFDVLGSDVSTKRYIIINSGILLFICESMVIFLFGNILKDVKFIDQAALWYVHASTYLFFLILIFWNHAKLNRTT